MSLLSPRNVRHVESAPRADRWMVPYADLLTLLLTLFVVLFVASRRGIEPQAALQAAPPAPPPSAALAASPPAAVSAPPLTASAPPASVSELALLRAAIDGLVAESPLAGRVHTRLERRGLVVSLVEAGFYDSGSASPRADALPFLDELARLLTETDHDLRVEGHTDDEPIRTASFPSNWELSTARATGLVRYLVERFDAAPSRLSAAGYAEFRPLDDNTTAEGRARNRRVDLVVVAPAIAAEEEPERP